MPRAAAEPRTGAGGPELARCEQHPERFADWVCGRCAKTWCPECAIVTKALSKDFRLVQCPACRERCAPTPRRERADARQAAAAEKHHSISWAILDALIRPIRGWNVLLLLGVGLLYLLADRASLLFVPVLAWTLARFAPIPYFLQIMRHAANGREGFPEAGSFDDVVWDLVIPGVRFVLGCWLVAVPAGVYAVLRAGAGAEAIAADSVFWGLLALGVGYLPGVLVTAAMTDSIAAAINPMYAIQLLARMRGDYVVLLGGVLAWLAVWSFAGKALGQRLSFVTPFVESYAVLALMTLAGNLLFRRRRDLGLVDR